MSNSIQKIRDTLSYSSNIDVTTSELAITKNVTQNISNAQLQTAEIDKINAFTSNNQNYGVDADFIINDIPTNSRVDNDELTKIKYASIYSTGINEDEKSKTLNLVSNIFCNFKGSAIFIFVMIYHYQVSKYSNHLFDL